jgi:hypothetical protein
VIVGDHGTRAFGIAPAERLARSFARAGIVAARDPASAPGDTIMVVRGDHVLDESLVRALAARPGVSLVDGAGRAVAAHVDAADAPALAAAFAAAAPVPPALAARLTACDAKTLASAHHQALRKRADPLLIALDGAARRAVERRLYDASYKGVTDLVTKYVWPWPAFHATRACAALGISPNLVTWVSLGFVIAALVLFRQGYFVAGLACAWAMCFLDTVDGKLARITLASSRFGNALDHGIDLIHPPFWYLAWAAALEDMGVAGPWHDAVVAVVVGGYVIGRLQEGLFLWLFRMELHVWRRLDSRFRLITARRNPNLLLLSAATIAGRPDIGFALIALWTILSLGFHFARIAMALAARRAGLRSWLDEPA